MMCFAAMLGLRSQKQLRNGTPGFHSRGHSSALPKKSSSEAIMRAVQRPSDEPDWPAFSSNSASNLVSRK